MEVMIEVRLYGKLRRFARRNGVGDESVLTLPWREGDNIDDVLARIGIPDQEISNIFVNGELSEVTCQVGDGDRIGVFPEDMGLLYKWYFPKKGLEVTKVTKVEVRLYAFLRKYRPETTQGEPLAVETEEGTTIAGLLHKLGIPEEVAKLTFVNGVQQHLSYVLQPNDSVGIFPPIAGG